MSEIDELPNWAVRSVQPGTVAPSNVPPAAPEPQPRRGRGFVVLLGLLGLAAAGALAIGGYWLTNRDDNASVATASPTTPGADTPGTLGSDEVESTDATVAAGSTTVAPVETSSASTTATSALTSDDIVTDEALITEENPAGALQYAILSQGTLYLRGKVQSTEIADRTVQVSEAVVGPGNVVNEYEVDPSVAASIPSPLYVEDVVLFGFNSVRVEPAFLPILDLGTLLMTQNPNVKITVVTRTDSVGDDETNLEVSQQRGQAVVDYWASKGIDPSRVTVDARGEADASGSDDAETSALDRRAEFIIAGLFD